MIDIDVLARSAGAVLWIAVLCRYILDVVPNRASAGNRVTQAGLGACFALLAFGAVRSIWISLEPSWLTYAFPTTALVMVIGQHWDTVVARLRPPRTR